MTGFALPPTSAMAVAQGIDNRRGLSPKGADGSGDEARYGMSMWFQVRVEGVGGNDKMGRWSTCSGLGVTFKSEAVKTTPSSIGATLVPLDVEYPDITLTRAMEPTSSAKVQKWLERVAETWMLDDGSSDAPPRPGERPRPGRRFRGTTVEIRLYSSLRPVAGAKGIDGRDPHEVARWVLYDVFPKSWSGPSLNASGNEIATEKLVLAHGGFLDPDRKDESSVVISDGTTSFRLPYPPVGLQVVQNVSARSATAAGLDPNSAVNDPDKANIAFRTTLVGAEEVAWANAQLFAWLRKKHPAWELAKGKTDKKGRKSDDEWVRKEHQAAVNLVIGSGSDAIKRTVIMRKCDFTVTRFTTAGLPSRADVSFSFEVLTKLPGKTLTQHPSARSLPMVFEESSTMPTQPASLKGPAVAGGTPTPAGVSLSRKSDTLAGRGSSS